MDSAKRKRKANGGIDERRTKRLETNEDQQATTVTAATSSTSISTRTIEDEAEEFFAILRRFHTAVRQYKKETNNNESKFKQRDLRFDQLKTGMEEIDVGGVKNQGKREEAVEENFVLDLNLVPNTDTNV